MRDVKCTFSFESAYRQLWSKSKVLRKTQGVVKISYYATRYYKFTNHLYNEVDNSVGGNS